LGIQLHREQHRLRPFQTDPFFAFCDISTMYTYGPRMEIIVDPGERRVPYFGRLVYSRPVPFDRTVSPSFLETPFDQNRPRSSQAKILKATVATVTRNTGQRRRPYLRLRHVGVSWRKDSQELAVRSGSRSVPHPFTPLHEALELVARLATTLRQIVVVPTTEVAATAR
jgi:hypothetical protein